MNTLSRFFSKIKQSDNGCYEWTAATTDGYGMFNLDGRIVRAHQMILVMNGFTELKEKEIDHLCRNRKCLNIAHLEIVSPRENNMRSNSICAINNKKTHCINGHELNKENTYYRKDVNGRCCKVCGRERNKERKRINILDRMKGVKCLWCKKPFHEWVVEGTGYKRTKYCSKKCCNKMTMKRYLDRHSRKV